jgi:rfaE bifunctional protein nucleotidyltransferase chain/domain
VQRLKGPGRPLMDEQDRAVMLAALECVDHVLIFDEDTPHELLRQIRPDVLVKGGTTDEVVGREVVEAYGGSVCRTGQIPGFSTTKIAALIRDACAVRNGPAPVS